MEYALVALWVVYLAPFTLAAGRDHPRTRSILALNLALGWTGIGWLAALAWAWPERRPMPRLQVVSPPVPGPRVPAAPSSRAIVAWPAAALTGVLIAVAPDAWPRAPWWPEPQGGVSPAHVERLGSRGAPLHGSANDIRAAIGALPGGCDVVVLEHRDGWKRIWKTARCLARAGGPSEGWIPAAAASPR